MGISSQVTSKLDDALKAPTSKAKAVAYGSAIGFILGEALGTNAGPVSRAARESAVSGLGSGVSVLGKKQVYHPKNSRINSAGGGKGHGDKLDKVEAEREKLAKSKVKQGKSGPLCASGKCGEDGFGNIAKAVLGFLAVEGTAILWGITAGVTKAVTGFAIGIIGKIWNAAKGVFGWMYESLKKVLGPAGGIIKKGATLAGNALRVGATAATGFLGSSMGAIAAGGAGSIALAGAAVAGAGYLGYKAGGMINDGINSGISAITDGEYSSLGDVIYELVEGTLGSELKEKFLAWGSELWTSVSTKVSSFASEYLLDPLTNWFTKTVPEWFETLIDDFKGMAGSGFELVASHVKNFINSYVMKPIVDWWNGMVTSDNWAIGKLMKTIGAERIDFSFEDDTQKAIDDFKAKSLKLIETATAPHMAVFNGVTDGAKAVGSAVGAGVDAAGNAITAASAKTISAIDSGIATTKGMIQGGDEIIAQHITGPKQNESYSFNTAAANQSQGIDGSLASLMNLIGQHESGNDYNRVVGTPKGSFQLTDLTIAELMDFQRERIQSGKNSASGRWQINLETLKDFYQKAGLALSDTFSPENQDKLFMALMNRRGAYDKYMRGEITKAQLADDMAKTWAALPMESGRSYYDGVNGNMAGVSRSDFLASIPGAGDSVGSMGVMASAGSTPTLTSQSSSSSTSNSSSKTTSTSVPIAATQPAQSAKKSSPPQPTMARVSTPMSDFFARDLSYTMA